VPHIGFYQRVATPIKNNRIAGQKSSHNLSNRLFAGPSLSKNRFRSVLTLKMFRRSIPMHMI
jgi:hypothetical protein